MIAIHFTMEDVTLFATRNEKCWDVKIVNTFVCRSYLSEWTDIQMSAALALAAGYGEEGGKPEVIEELYNIARPLFETEEYKCDISIIP
jgi:hypothetical protein